ncbi:DUF373 family protein [Candidatus Micrarchaeota archaeon]|nr:DUF373 family protein [Candidatus Micrarchaeota archaeon]
MSKKRRVLVLCVDVDDDLGEKARVRGPVVGRKANLAAASKLGVVDPEDSDVNTMFAGLHIYDELAKEHEDVEIATVTGVPEMGYKADRRIFRQLETVLSKFPADGCIFVSDGASDEQLLPLIQSRIKIDGVKRVTVKQTKELEKTYFVILEKLREPHFARIVFGIPGLLLLLFAFSEYLGFRLLLAVLGSYLVFKGIGLEEKLFKAFSGVQVSLENQAFIFNFAAAALVVVSFLLGASDAYSLPQANALEVAALFLRGIFPLFPIGLLVYLVGDLLRVMNEKKLYLLPKQVTFASAILLAWLVLNNAAEWVLGSLGFAEFFYSLILVVAAMYLFTLLSDEFRRSILAKLNLSGKDVYTEIGGFVGKIAGINPKKETFVVETSAGQKIDLDFDHISDLGENVIIKY